MLSKLRIADFMSSFDGHIWNNLFENCGQSSKQIH